MAKAEIMQAARKHVTMIPATLEQYTSVERCSKYKRRVAAYARVSTDREEQQTSYETQLHYYENYIRGRDDWEFIKVYADEGISGLSTVKRNAFNMMVADALAGKIDLIITKSVSRFARNTVDSLTTIRKLKENGVECYFEKENIWTFDSKGELLLTIMSSIAQEESRSISENIRWGKRKAMAEGVVHVSCTKFLGYKNGPNGEMLVDEEQAVIVRRIYSMYLQGYTPTAIAKVFTSEGILTPFGATKWRYHTVLRILTNEKYKGDAILQKYYVTDFLTKKMVKNNGELQQYYVKGDHEAIIEPEVFDHVQRLLTIGGKGTRQSSMHILAAKIYCGDCGGYYGSKVWHSNDKYRKVIWQCNQKYEGGHKCSTPHLTEEQVKILFVRALNDLLIKREDIVSKYDDIINVRLATDNLEKKRKETESEMAELEKKNENLVNMNAVLTLDQDEYQVQRDDILERYEALRQEMRDLMQEINGKTVRREQLHRFRHEFIGLEVMEEFDNLKWVSMLEKMVVYSKDKIVFVFRDGSEVVESV